MRFPHIKAQLAGNAQLAAQTPRITNEYATRVYPRIFWKSQILAITSILFLSLAVVYTPEDTDRLVARAQVACKARVKWKKQALSALAVGWGPPLAGSMGWEN